MWWIICSLRFGFHFEIYRLSRIFRFFTKGDARHMGFQSNLWMDSSVFSPFSAFRCFDGSELPDGLSCSAKRTSAHLLVSPMYFAPHVQTPSYTTEHLCVTLSLSGKQDLILHVFQITMNLTLGHKRSSLDWNFLARFSGKKVRYQSYSYKSIARHWDLNEFEITPIFAKTISHWVT